MNQMCKVCGEPAAGFHFGAFTCEGCKSFFGRTYNNLSSISECKNNGECVINKKNRTACKACRLRKCLLVGMSKSGSRYGRRSNWFKIHCLLQEQQQQKNGQTNISGGGNSDSGSGGGGGGAGRGGRTGQDGDTGDVVSGRNGSLFLDAAAAGMEKNMSKYLEHFGTSAMNAFRIRNNNNNNNNNCESKYNFYEDNKKLVDFAKGSSFSKSEEEEEEVEEENSNHSSSIVVDEDSQPNRDESPSLDSHHLMNNRMHHHQHQHHLHHQTVLGGTQSHHQLAHHHQSPLLFRPGVEPISPFSQKYHDFFLSPFLHSMANGLKRPLSNSEAGDYEVTNRFVDQETPIDLSIKSKISRISPSGGGGANNGHGISITSEAGDRLKSSTCDLEKKNPLDLSLSLPTRLNPILG